MSKLQVETIWPERAREILAVNDGNRKVRPRAVATYARDMVAGNWKLTGAPICLNGSRLLDGQHRLLACAAAEVPFETAVLYDADESIHVAIDKGMRRTAADELRWRGEVDVNNLAAAISLLWQYENEAFGRVNFDASIGELVSFLDAHGQIRDSVRQAGIVRRQLPIPVGAFSVVHYEISTRHSAKLADTFTTKLASGTDMVEGDPILVMRKYAVRVAGNRQFRPRREEWLAVLLKTANMWLLGRPVKNLAWRRVGPAAEPFPRLVAPDETDPGAA